MSIIISSNSEKEVEMTFNEYLRSFDYEERKRMKIGTEELLELYAKGEAEIVDIRFPEEYEAWHFGFGKHIPLNELPDRLNELDRSKVIITVCPHKDRAEIARLYLTFKGFRARYYTEGLLKLADYLRGDRAKKFMERIKKD